MTYNLPKSVRATESCFRSFQSVLVKFGNLILPNRIVSTRPPGKHLPLKTGKNRSTFTRKIAHGNQNKHHCKTNTCLASGYTEKIDNWRLLLIVKQTTTKKKKILKIGEINLKFLTLRKNAFLKKFCERYSPIYDGPIFVGPQTGLITTLANICVNTAYAYFCSGKLCNGAENLLNCERTLPAHRTASTTSFVFIFGIFINYYWILEKSKTEFIQLTAPFAFNYARSQYIYSVRINLFYVNFSPSTKTSFAAHKMYTARTIIGIVKHVRLFDVQ